MPHTNLHGRDISYEIEYRPRRRHPAIQITETGQVRVLLPADWSTPDAERILQDKATWVLRHLAMVGPVPPAVWENGQPVYWLGHCYRLAWDPALKRPAVVLDEEYCRVGGPADAMKFTIKGWMRQEAQVYLPQRLGEWAEHLALAPSRVKVGEYKTRWGYCRSDGLIALNWRLMQAPPSIMDYVIVHELVHLRHLHHQPSFWQSVAEVLPDYQARRQSLREWEPVLKW
ncbi:MAG: SprT family zinc-dependent metalloprotease [Sulfobacillus sp.]|nr:SprT family zinc-dependent metalloprotease [Sulfobacillus sp.]